MLPVSETLKVPAIVGVPVIAPVDAFSVKPVGNPVADQVVMVPLDGVGTTHEVYADDCGAVTSATVNVGAGPPTVSLSGNVVEPELLLTTIESKYVPVEVLVPVIAPVEEFIAKPSGRPVTAYENDALEADVRELK